MDNISNESNRYGSIDGLRAYSAIGIILMHMRSTSNNNYSISGTVFNTIIPFLTNLVFLFMIISAFSMCCGYYEKYKDGTISISSFYEKRIRKIWPFFAVLVLVDFIMGASINTMLEAFANLTLCFGLLPNNNFSVIGVGWFIGVIFVFYMLFPFFCCFILKNKKRAWLALVVTIILNISCSMYFFDRTHVVDGYSARTNILFCSMFFVAGGLVYLYRIILQSFVERFRRFFIAFIIFLTVTYFFQTEPLKYGTVQCVWMLLIFSSWLIYSIGAKSVVLCNPVVKFVSDISMEIYLSHMMIFRIIDRLHLNYLFGTCWLSYIVTVCVVIIGTIIFSMILKKMLAIIENNEIKNIIAK